MRESPAVEIMELIRDAGGDPCYSDPHVPVFPKMREHKFDLSSVPLDGRPYRACGGNGVVWDRAGRVSLINSERYRA